MLRHDKFLFDLDGVIVDTKDIQVSSTIAAIEKICHVKILDTKLIESTITTREKLKLLSLEGLIDQDQIDLIYNCKKEIAEQMMLEMNPEHYQDKRQIFEFILLNKGRFSVVTNANKSTSQMILDHLQISGYDLLVTNQDVKNTKPSSEPYITAMLKMGGHIRDYLIFEDSEVGLASARGTGADVFFVSDCKLLNIQKFIEADKT